MIRVQDRQCLIDVALTAVGSVEGVISLARLNGLSITDTLRLHRRLTYASVEVLDRNIVHRYQVRGISPATE